MSHRARTIAGWLALAVAGLAVAVVVSYTASKLVAQDVGLPGRRGAGGAALAPARTATTTARPTRTATTPARTQTTDTATDGGDDHSGRGGESGDDRGYHDGDDD
jgi:hypothetical protein